MKNIVLIGMPGSGKSTVLALLGKQLDRPTMDTDLYMVEKEGKTVQQMFDISEQYFRDKETATYKEIACYDGWIIATGGGAVKRPQNIQYLRQNGVTFLLERSCENIIGDIDISGRPLLKSGAQHIYDLYNQRKDMYLASADVIIDNNGTLENTVRQIIEYCKENNII